MTVDPDILNFFGAIPIDQVVITDEYRATVLGPSGPTYYNSDNIDTIILDNPYGKKAFVEYRWSIDDGVTFNSPETLIEYDFIIDASALGGPAASPPIPGTKAGVAMGVSANEILIQFINGYHGKVTYTAGDDSYTGIDLDFIVQYAIYEVE